MSTEIQRRCSRCGVGPGTREVKVRGMVVDLCPVCAEEWDLFDIGTTMALSFALAGWRASVRLPSGALFTVKPRNGVDEGPRFVEIDMEETD